MEIKGFSAILLGNVDLDPFAAKFSETESNL